MPLLPHRRLFFCRVRLERCSALLAGVRALLRSRLNVMLVIRDLSTRTEGDGDTWLVALRVLLESRDKFIEVLLLLISVLQ